MMFALHAIEWTEYERGWGSRPDGVSFHPSHDAAQKHIDDFIGRRDPRHVPDEYSDPGDIKLVEVSEDFYRLVQHLGLKWVRTIKIAQDYRKDADEPAVSISKPMVEELKPLDHNNEEKEMTSEQFCYWMQGLFEIADPQQLDARQTELIKRHLSMVFLHDLDKRVPEDQRQSLNAVHQATSSPHVARPRC